MSTKSKWHFCYWTWLTLLPALVPFLHILLHLFGIAHPETIQFIP